MADKLKQANLSRTAYDNWTLQLKAYENMLGQIGLVTEESKIVALLYQTDANNKFLGDVLHIFQGNNYFDYATHAEVVGDNGFWKTDPVRTAERLKEYRDAIDAEIPIGNKEVEDELEKIFKNLEFTPTEEENQKVMDAIMVENGSILSVRIFFCRRSIIGKRRQRRRRQRRRRRRR